MNRTPEVNAWRRAVWVALLAVATPWVAHASQVGRIKTVEGAAHVERGGERIAAVAGTELELGDVIETGSDGAVGVLFEDDSRLALGPGARLAIDEFLFDPEGDDGAFLLKLARGTLHMVSGLIAKVSPQKARVDTPVGTVGIRGTRLLVRVGGGAS